MIEKESNMDIVNLINQPESKTLEFKRDLSSIEPILKTIVAFANTAGGVLVIGKTQDGALIGLKDVFKMEERLVNSIADNILPSMLPEIEIMTVQGQDLLIVKVSHWKGPFYLKKEGVPKGVYIRLGSTSRPAGPELLEEMQRSSLRVPFDQQPIPELSQKSVSLDIAARIFKRIKKEINEEKMRSLGVLVQHAHHLVPSIGGLILFGKEEVRREKVPDARVSCARFLGITKVDILDQYEMQGTLIEAIDEVSKFIIRNTTRSAEIKTMQRKDIPQYPVLGIREALINALVHTDYSIKGSHIQIAIFDDRLEIQNPGMFPFGFTMEDFKAGVSRIRNRVIARVFHELTFMESWGSGYKRILETCRKEGYPEPFWEEFGTAIRVTFYPYSNKTIQKTLTRDPTEGREIAIMILFEQKKEMPFSEIIKQVVPAVSERTLRYDLARLKKKGLLFSKGKGRATIWCKAY